MEVVLAFPYACFHTTNTCTHTYLQGVSGIGVVNAMEVVLAFPGVEGLRAFREWVDSPDAALVGMAAQKFGGRSDVQDTEGETGQCEGSEWNCFVPASVCCMSLVLNVLNWCSSFGYMVAQTMPWALNAMLL